MDNIKKDVVAAWGQVHLYLEKKLPGHAIHAWFEPIVPTGFRNNSFVLEVPNQFFLEWIESHYRDDIIMAIEKTYSEKIEYKFLVTKEKNEKKDREFSKPSFVRGVSNIPGPIPLTLIFLSAREIASDLIIINSAPLEVS